MAEVLLHPHVERWLLEQQPDVERPVRSKLEQAGENPDHFLTPIKGHDNYKLRTGNNRCEID